MNTKKYYLIAFLSCLLSIQCGFAQTQLLLYYDKTGKGVDTTKNFMFYRSVTLDKNNKPIDTIRDYYANGQCMSRGMASYIDKLNTRKSAWIGKCYRYNEKGKLRAIQNFDDNGMMDGVQTTFNPDGSKADVYEYIHGNPSSETYVTYTKEGEQQCSYLTHLPIKPVITDNKIVPFTERKAVYQDGSLVQFYFIDGLSVAVKLSDKQQYGHYYEAFVTIENGSGDQFDFDPSYITASLSLKGVVKDAQVYAYDDYMKKVSRRQAWSTAFTTFAEMAAATSAGYSSSTTNVYGITSSGRLISAHVTTSSYNGAAQYAATQNAANNVNQLVGQQYEIKRNISEGYLKLNTIFPNSRLIGFVNINFDSADKIYLNIPVNGKIYHFEFSDEFD